MTALSDMAADLVSLTGETVTWTQAGEDATPSVIVTDHGLLSEPPTGFDPKYFSGQARYALFRVPPAALVPTDDDTVTYNGRTYEVRQVAREPRTGNEVALWLAWAAADQRGRGR